MSNTNWGVTSVALGVGTGAEWMKVGVGGVGLCQEPSYQGDLASQKSSSPMETTCKVGHHCINISPSEGVMPLYLCSV